MVKNTAYTKKVFEHFQNPKNLGEIKNADAVGTLGNPVCLPPNEKIYLNGSLTEIKKSKKNDLVNSHDSTRNKVLLTPSRKYSGRIIFLQNNLGKVNLTPEHLILAIKLPTHYNYLRTRNKQKLIPSWYHAKDLKKRDIILYPIMKNTQDKKVLEIDIPKYKYDFKSKKIPKKISVNDSLLRLIGYFMSEGNIQDKPSKTYISFTLNINENDIARDISKISKEIFDIEVKIKEIPKRNTLIVYLYNAQLARFFKKLFGNGAQNKKLPEFIMSLPTEKQKSLIYGLWRGDGYINLNRKGPRAGYATISYQLSQQIKVLLLRQEIIPSIYEEKAKISKWANHKKAYRIHIGQRNSLINLCKILKIKYTPKSYISVTSWLDKNFLYTPITKIKNSNYSGKVHNLEVETTHSYLSEAFTLHNCGDVMKIYLKISKNKAGKEIIKDIKFQTMGCAAAIATSSMITELAKGKTLAQAKKITNQNVSSALKGLPPIKMHCSNLAANCLKDTISKYENKRKK
jgi:nitrogen fixation protein NifU and related proteins